MGRHGQLSPATGREAFCAGCAALWKVEQNGPNSKALFDAIFDKMDRISIMHANYRRKRR